MARILIGNIKGPKGDTGPQGTQGPTGPQGPKGDTGPMPALINNAATTSAGVGALDAAMGKTLGDQINVLNNNISYRYLLGEFDLVITEEIQTIELPSFSGYSRVIWVFKEEGNNATYIAEIDAGMFDQITNLTYFFRFRDSQEFSINIIPGSREIRLFGDISVTIKLKKVYGAK